MVVRQGRVRQRGRSRKPSGFETQ
ncbi:hypothetical protein Celaphus_00003782 [Cervus elaphus hippelaphus]|uniref:Uncharacterized protein n=2 Tax=Amniota TaxID=32524 RepID=A0A212D0Y1_CEREH|nr:hypothetical protein Celaphus_00003782 [Cervus elaphus hippelaphus]